MIEIRLHGRNGSRTIAVRSPRGFPTRHVRTRQMPVPAPKPPPEPTPVETTPVCPVLAAFHTLQRIIGGNGYFIFDEIFRVVRHEGTAMNQHTPNPRHRYHPNCQCEPCRHVRYTLMGIKPRVQMTEQELQTLLNACHDYGTVHEGDFPSLDALRQAQVECRLRASDMCSQGEILIVGRDACYVTFKVD